MTKSKIKRNIKKHNTKKIIKKKIIKKESTKQLVNTQQNNNNNNNNLRQQLLKNNIFPFGYSQQQYGNISNQRRIEQLMNDNQTIAQKIGQDNATIDTLKKENVELKEDLKKRKSELRGIKSAKEKAESDLETTKIQLDEATRIERETKNLRSKNAIAKQQLDEINSANNILKLKTEGDSLESEVNSAKLLNIHLKNQMDSNKEYQRVQELKREHAILLNENNGMQEAMKDESFTNPNKELVKTTKQLEIEKYRRKLLDKQIKKQEEINQLNLQIQSTPDEKDLKEYVDQYTKAIKDNELEIIDTKERLYNAQQPIREYEDLVKRRNDLEQQLLNLKHEHESLSALSAKLNDQKNKGINKFVEQKLANVAQQQENNEFVQRQIERTRQFNKLREEKVILDSKIESLKKDLSPEEKDEIEKLSKQEEDNQLKKESIQTLRQQRKVKFETSKLNSKNAYLNSPEYNKMCNNIAKQEGETQIMIEQNKQMDLLNKATQKKNEAVIAKNVQDKVVEQDLNSVKQVIFLTEELTENLNELTEKSKIIKKLNEYRRNYLDLWEQFVASYKSTDISNISTFENLPISILKEILNGFSQYVKDAIESGYDKPPLENTSQMQSMGLANTSQIQLPVINPIITNNNNEDTNDTQQNTPSGESGDIIGSSNNFLD